MYALPQARANLYNLTMIVYCSFLVMVSHQRMRYAYRLNLHFVSLRLRPPRITNAHRV